MEIEILGAESLGVRGLSCWVKTANHRVLIDPGVALGYQRQSLLPHPIQLLADEPIARILAWSPTTLLVSGPALYRDLPADELAKARDRAMVLARNIDVCIIDHHLLRCRDGVQWLDELRAETHGKILCAADYMNRERRFLEARRVELYGRMSVPQGWHEVYAKGLVDTSEFRTGT